MTPPLTDDELSRAIDRDLHELLRRYPPVVAVHRTSPLQSPVWEHATFRIDLVDGRLMKGHQLESADAAERAVQLGRLLPSGSFSRIVDQYGRALLSEWIGGVSLSSRAITKDDCGKAGAIMRSIHQVVLPDTVPESVDRYPGATSMLALSKKVERLCALGQLTASEGEQVARLVVSHLPSPVRKTLIHGDICPENIVVDRRNLLQLVDNDGVDVHAPEFDLARTWYRWPMTGGEREAFENGYGDATVLSLFHMHFLHWAPVVLIGAAEFRLQHQLPGAEGALGRLRALLPEASQSKE